MILLLLFFLSFRDLSYILFRGLTIFCVFFPFKFFLSIISSSPFLSRSIWPSFSSCLGLSEFFLFLAFFLFLGSNQRYLFEFLLSFFLGLSTFFYSFYFLVLERNRIAGLAQANGSWAKSLLPLCSKPCMRAYIRARVPAYIRACLHSASKSKSIFFKRLHFSPLSSN